MDEDGRTYAGMGVDFDDFNNDGLPDLVVDNLANQMYAIYQNAGDGTFNYTTRTSGMGRITMLHSGLGTSSDRLRQRRLEGSADRARDTTWIPSS